jgi:prevent-host-death family protein
MSYMSYMSYMASGPMTVSARQANHEFSELLSRVERGEEVLITKRSKPVAVLCPYRPPLLTPERQKAIDHAIEVMAKGPMRCSHCAIAGRLRLNPRVMSLR